MSFFKRLKAMIVGNSVAVNEKYSKGLEKAKGGLKERFNALLARYRSVDDAFFDSLTDILITSDVGAKLAYDIVENMKAQVRIRKIEQPSLIVELLIENLYNLYSREEKDVEKKVPAKPQVILVVGVNGVGKTTSIAKLANKYKNQGHKVVLVAGDTFRAGAVEQLSIWAKRLDVELVQGSDNSDPASVIFEGISKGIALESDVIICDTAGRLHTKVNLMNELSKIKRVIEKKIGRGPDEILLVIDATTGQNGVQQAKAFTEATTVSGIILTKMDGTSKGGIILAIKDQLGIDVKYIGLGETVNDLVDFDINSYLHSLFAQLLE